MSLEEPEQDSLNSETKQKEQRPEKQLVPEQYALLARISEGGMGSIYSAQNRFTRNRYAIKVLLAEFAEDPEFRQRFISEARLAGMLRHPNICQVHDFGVTSDHSLYLVMDWIEGMSLQSKVTRDGPLETSTALQIYEQMASALSHAHTHEIVHRDIKPDNIMLSKAAPLTKPHACLVDFGLAKSVTQDQNKEHQGLTTVGTTVGTPLYMSPEQARAQEVDGRTDIYALGCVMYFALSGHPPFEAETSMDTMFKHINEAPPEFDPKLKIPSDLKNIIFKSMEKSRNDRYDNAESLLKDLSKVSQGVSVGKITLTSEHRKAHQKKVNIALFILGFVVMYVVSTFAQSLLEKFFPENAGTHIDTASHKK